MLLLAESKNAWIKKVQWILLKERFARLQMIKILYEGFPKNSLVYFFGTNLLLYVLCVQHLIQMSSVYLSVTSP